MRFPRKKKVVAVPFDRTVRQCLQSVDGVAWRAWHPALTDEAADRSLPLLIAVTPVWSTRALALETAFNEPATAAYINRSFIPVRIDPAMRPLPANLCVASGFAGLTVIAPDGSFAGSTGFPEPAELRNVLEALAAAPAMPGRADGAAGIDAVLDAYHRSVAAAYDGRTGTFSAGHVHLPAMINSLSRRLFGTGDHGTADMLHAALARVTETRADTAYGGFSAAAGERSKTLAANSALIGAFLQAYRVTGRSGYAETASGAAVYIDSVLFSRRHGYYASGKVAGSGGRTDTLVRYAENAVAAAVLAEAAVVTDDRPDISRYRAVLDTVMAAGQDGKTGLYYRTSARREPFFLEDQAQICRSLLAMYELTGADRYAEAARAVADRVSGRFADGAEDGFHGAVSGYGPVDGCRSAAAEALMLEAFSRLDFLYESGTYGAVYDALMPAVIACAAGTGLRGAELMTALEEPFAPLVEIFVVGGADDPMTGRMLAAVKKRYLPFARIKVYEPRRGGHRRGALIFPFFLKPVCYAALNGYLHGAFERPEDLARTLENAGF